VTSVGIMASGYRVSAPVYGAAQTLIVSGSSGLTDPVTNVTNREGGVRVSFNAPGRVRQVRFRRRSDSAGTLMIRAWNDSTQAKLTEVADVRSTTGLYTVTFPIDVLVVAGTNYTFSVGGTGAGSLVPITGIDPTVTNTAGMTFSVMRDASAGAGNWPNQNSAGNTYYVEPIYEPQV